MDTRATRTRLSVIPVFIALLFNIVAPVLAMAVPEAVPDAVAPKVAVAADAPDQVTFTLEGCRLENGDFIEATFTCTEPGYTTGNLGKEWAELDRVPHRLTASNGNGTQTYDINISADYLNDGTIGYDIISVPTLKSGPCTFVVSDQVVAGGQAGGADTTISRTLTITQPADTTCVFDYNQRLALGSSGYSGSSLHAYLLAEGVGEKRVPLPVDQEFPAQELRKEMTATQGQAYTWSVSKSSDPVSLAFLNTCATTEGARSANVNVTVSWTRSGPTATGNTVVTTNIYANNPSERTILVAVSDVIYTGTDQSSPAIDTASAAATAVPANTELLLLTHSFEYAGAATQFNDVATATYTDPINPDVTIPGNTTATASATAVPAGGTPANASAVITDSESITGTGLSFSVAAPSSGTFTNYTAGDSVTPGSTVEWSSGTVSGSGSITFAKTVSVDQARITSGTLTDTATVKSTDGQTTLATSDPLNIGITTDAQVALTINKTIPEGSLRSGESATFNFDVTGPDSFEDTASITINFGDLSGSTELTGLAPGEYTVSEQAQAGWADHSPQSDTITLPDCAGEVTFNNTELPPALTPLKTADDEVVSAGEEIGFVVSVSNSAAAGTGLAKDVEIDDNLPGGAGIDWEIADDSLDGGACAITGELGSEVLECAFGDLAPGESASVHVVSDTTAASCALYENTATISASNVDPDLTASADTTVECPGLNLIKTADEDPIVAGDEASFTITFWNAGPGDAFDATLHEDLPAGLTWDFEVVSGDATEADCMVASSLVLGGEESMTVDCNFGTLGVTSMADGIVLRFFATTDRTDCGLLENSATADASNLDEPLTASASILVRCPTLVIDKVADAELITITGPNNALVATPSVVTWTLTYTLTEGPVTNAVIRDEIPVGFEFLDASDGGTLVDGEVIWTFAELNESGFVTFRTTVDPETISRTAPTVNTAIISSNETPEDEGQDSVTVTREEELGGNPPLPNTAIGTGLNGEPITVPIELLVAFFIGSLGALALANVKARNNRR